MGDSSKEDIASKLVQEISKNGGVPERYILREGPISEAIYDNSNLWEQTLLIDFSILSSHSSLAQQNEVLKLQSALKDWGCFQVINHGMSNLFLDELVEVSKQFFALPLEKKLKSCDAKNVLNGYGNTMATAGDKPLNWNDRLFLTVYPEDQIKLEVWPQQPPRFRELLHDYSQNIRMILEVVFKAMAQSLNLKEDSFIKQHGERGSVLARFSIYPRCPQPDQVYGVHPHSDASTITILLQDKDVSQGLDVQKDDKWFNVPVIPGALFFNLGDFAEVMSNGIFKSAMHRVVTNSEKDRVSVAAFCIPEPEIEVGPINELISTNQPQLYNKMNMQTYKQLLFQTYSQGKRVADALKI